MNGSRRVVAGFGDAGFAALGTFLAGIVAVRELDVPALAVYAVVFSAAVLAMLLPRQLHYIPAQISANLEESRIAPIIGRDVRSAAVANAVAAAIVVAVPLTLVGRAPVQVCIVLGVTAAAYTVISPMQDHVRSALHLVDRHLSAAACSAVGAAVVAGAAALALANHQAAWIVVVPFGALTLANAASLVVGLALLRGAVPHRGYRRATRTVRMRFLLSEVAIQAAWFGCNYAILVLLDSAALAHLEAARIIASPVQVLVTALLTFVGPAMLRRLRPTAEHPHGPRDDLVAVMVLLLAVAVAYTGVLALAGAQVGVLLDKPFDLGLWAARIGSTLVEGCAAIGAFLVFALARSRVALVNSLLAGGIGLVGTVALAPLLSAYALPLGQGLGNAVRFANSMRVVRSEAMREPLEEPATV